MTHSHVEGQVLNTGLDPTMRLWRYARLSTLLLLLEHRAYLPSVRQLQAGDPTESMYADPRQTARFEQLSDADQAWLMHRATDEEADLIRHARESSERAAVFAAVWRRELANRRCAWAWYGSDIESMALWNIYAMEGVAIGTTVQQLMSAVAKTGRSLHPQLRAVTYLDFSRDEKVPADLIMQPYFVKQSCYAHENEIRLVCSAADSSSSGMSIEVDPEVLIQEIALSPWMPDQEAEAVRNFVGRHPAMKGKQIAKSQAHRPPQTCSARPAREGSHRREPGSLEGIINADLTEAKVDPGNAGEDSAVRA